MDFNHTADAQNIFCRFKFVELKHVKCVSQHTGFCAKQWSGLKHLELMDVSANHLDCCGLEHKGNSDASEGPVARCIEFGTFNHESLKGASFIATDDFSPSSEQLLVGFQIKGRADVTHTHMPRISPTS